MVSVPYACYRFEINFSSGVGDETISLCIPFLQSLVPIKNLTRNSFYCRCYLNMILAPPPSISHLGAQLRCWDLRWADNGTGDSESIQTTIESLSHPHLWHPANGVMVTSREMKKMENKKIHRLRFRKLNACLRMMRGLIDISDRNPRN